MEEQKPSILIVHGAWHHPAYFKTFIDLLSTQGYPVICPHLPTCSNDDPPTKALEDDVELICATATELADKGQEIIAVVHAYGGVVGTQALHGLGVAERAKQGKGGGVKRLVYMCAFVPHAGQTLAAGLGGTLPPWIEDRVCSDIRVHQMFDLTNSPQPNGIIVPVNTNDVFYHDTKDPSYWTSQLLKHPKAAQTVATVSKEAWRSIPVTYLVCENDHALPSFVQKMLVGKVEEAGVKVDVETCSASHSPFLSMPDKVVEVIERAAKS